MTFHTEQRFSKSFYLLDNNSPLKLSNNYSVYWVFVFADKTIERITGTVANDIAEFEIPEGFFSADRRGELTHRLVISDSDGSPYLHSTVIEDKLIDAGITRVELGL